MRAPRSRPVTTGRRLAIGLATAIVGAAIAATPATASVGAPAAAPPPSQATISAQGTAAIERATSGHGRVTTDPVTKRARFVGTSTTNPIPRAAGVSAGASPEAKARGFLKAYGAMFGVRDQASELRLEDRPGSVVPFQQVHGGIPVVGGELLVNLDAKGNVLSANGEISPDLALDVSPTVTAGAARQAAGDVAAKAHGSRGAVDAAPALWVYDPALLGGGGSGPARLVWRMELSSDGPEPFRDLVLVDAQTSGIALTINELDGAENRSVCNDNNVVGAAEACTAPVRTEGQAATGVVDVDRAYDYAGDTYAFYQSKFGRDSLDNAGMALKSTVKYCPDAQNCPYQNAYWNGSGMVYGDGFSAADDVVGHELTHGVTEFESHLFYYYQSGAINESLSDVFGELIDQQNGAGTDTAAVKWLMGEDLPSIGAIRNMANPPAFSDPDRMQSANYYAGTSDEGGVHTNSGVNNKAAFLMSDGGTFNGQTITGLGGDKTARIYYATATNLLTSAADYQDLYDGLQQGCTNLVGTNAITAADCTQVAKVVQATEMNLQPTNAVAQAAEAPVCSAGTVANNLFSDDMENTASGNWAKTAIAGTQTWAYPQNPNAWSGFDATYATSGTANLFGADLPSTADNAIGRTANVVPPVGKTTYLRFRHAFGLENTYDGGRVEYSVTNGSSWVDAGSLFTEGGYNGTSTAVGGGAAFSGQSHGYYSSRLNLTSLAGQSVRYRFRLASDSSVGEYGWWIDDVRVYTCDAPASAPGAPTIGTATAGNGQAGLTWTAPASDGGSAITGYVVTPYIGASAQPTQTFNSTATTQTVTGLANGTAYTFRVAAKNAVGTGPTSADSVVVYAGAPAAPGFQSAQPGNANAKVGWFAPGNNGSPITGYVITPYIGAEAQAPQTFNTTATTDIVTGLSNGTTYTFKVAAINANGTGPTATTNAVLVGTPNAPGLPNTVPLVQSAKVSWIASNANAAPIQGYVVTPYIGSVAQTPTTFNGTGTYATVTGVTTGTTYTFRIAGFNSLGTGPTSETRAVTVGTPSNPGFQVAVPGNNAAKVKFTTPAANSAPITSYTVWPVIGSTQGSPQVFNTPGATTLDVTGLVNGTVYTFRVAASSSIGLGAIATTSPITVGTPTAPSFVGSQPGNTTARVAWQASAPNGAPIVAYAITPYIGTTAKPTQTFNSTATSQIVTGLVNGSSYTFKVAALNSFGTGPSDGTWTPIIAGTPTSPAFPSAKPGNASAIVSWQASTANASPVTGYRVTPYLGTVALPTQVFNSTATTQTISGLVNGNTYTFAVAGFNAVGIGPVGTTGAVKVGVPSLVARPTASAGAGSATVTWVAPADNGSAITGYLVTPIKAGVAQAAIAFDASSTSRLISGLTPGSTYTFTVAAVNGVGTGAASNASAAVIPT